MPYLAMTAAELENCRDLPPKIAWMACHFSPYNLGLTNLPSSLPVNSLLILNDRTPVCGHDPILVADTLTFVVEKFDCFGILLDLQQPRNQETDAIVEKVLSIGKKVCVTEEYAKEKNCAVFLPPCPALMPLNDYIKPWQNREVWLELALTECTASITRSGCAIFPVAKGQTNWIDTEMCLNYGVQYKEDRVEFSLKRTRENLQGLMEAGIKHGVTQFVGLWQELG